jgi:hypothetical protein
VGGEDCVCVREWNTLDWDCEGLLLLPRCCWLEAEERCLQTQPSYWTRYSRATAYYSIALARKGKGGREDR